MVDTQCINSPELEREVQGKPNLHFEVHKELTSLRPPHSILEEMGIGSIVASTDSNVTAKFNARRTTRS